MKHFKIFLILIVLNVQLLAQNYNVSLDTNVIEFGNQTTMRLQVSCNQSDVIVFPEFKDTIGDGIELVVALPLDTISINPFTVEKSYIITSFEDSIRTIPALQIFVNTDTIQTNQLQILVTPLDVDSAFVAQVDTTQMIPIFELKDVMNAKFTFREFWLRFGRWILLSLGILLIIFILSWLVYRKIKNKPIKIIKKPQIPAHVLAFEKLDKLKEKKLFKPENSKEYYSELTGIIRIYIEQRFKVPALENTSTELLSSIKSLNLLSKEQLDELKILLNVADLAKFAKYKQLQNINQENLDKAYIFIENTKINTPSN